MEDVYAALDVSDKTTQGCIVEGSGPVIWSGACPTDPQRGIPAVCVCARHAKGVLSAQVNKSDVHDAEGLAQMARTGGMSRSMLK
jgi:transposase